MHVEQRPLFALGLRLAAALAVSTLYMLVKLANSTGIALPEIMFWRQAVPVPVILAYLASKGGLAPLRTQRLKSHAGRATSGTLGMVLNFGSSILLPLAVATILSFTTPLFAVVLGVTMLGERVGPWRSLAVVLGFCGVLVIAQPGSLQIPLKGAACGLAAAFMVALISIQIRDLGRTEQPISTVFWFSLFGTIFTLPMLPFVITHHSLGQWLILGGIGTVGLLGQILMTSALRYGSVSSVIVMDYTSIIWMTLYGWVIFRQLPPATTWLGAPLVVAAGLVIAWREHMLALDTRRQEQAEAA